MSLSGYMRFLAGTARRFLVRNVCLVRSGDAAFFIAAPVGQPVPRPKLEVSRRIPEDAMAILQAHCDCRSFDHEETPVPRETPLKELADAEGAFVLLTDRIDEEVLAAAPRLRIVANMAVGYDNIDVAACTRR